MRLAAALFVLAAAAAGAAAPNPARRLQSIVDDLVAGDPAIRNCVLALARGDGSFAWSSAAGVSRGEPMSAQTPIYAASVTKLYTATLVMLLHERGALSLEDPMAKFLPADLVRGINRYGGTEHSGEVTLAQLLSHRSGIADYYTERGGDRNSVAELLRRQPARRWSIEQLLARVRDDLQPRAAPGARTYYSDTNYLLLGKVIEAVTGRPLHEAYEQSLFKPLGLHHTWLVGHPRGAAGEAPVAQVFRGDADITLSRSNPAYWADGGIVSTAPEMLAFLKALNTGVIVKRESLALMHQWHNMDFPLQYGYGTMRFDATRLARKTLGVRPLWGHSGSTGSFLYYCEELDVYLAGTIDQTESKVKPFVLMERALRAVAMGSASK